MSDNEYSNHNMEVLKPKREKRVKRPQSEAQKMASQNNGWFAHLREYREQNPDVTYKQAMRDASPSWKEKKASMDK